MIEKNLIQEILAEQDGWHKAWMSSLTPWDHGTFTPGLRDFMESSEYPEIEKGRALVPGCGSGWDVFLLAQTPGREYVVGLDISTKAKEVAEKVDRGISPDIARFIATDFFTYKPELPFNVIYDHTFLCALVPSQRPQWAAKTDKMAELLESGGYLITYMYPLSSHKGGPPYALSVEIYRELLSPAFEEIFVEDVLDTFETRKRQEYGEKLGLWKKK